jgi:hypothetical protein
VQRPAPQARFLQLDAPPQVIAHDLLAVQSMPMRHELAVEHSMSQLQPVGQVICRAHSALFAAQSTLQVLASLLHDVHCAGQAGGDASGFTAASAGTTHSPSVQVRPLAQSACFSHANSSLWWLIEQPLAAATAIPTTTTSHRATGFIACLQS